MVTAKAAKRRRSESVAVLKNRHGPKCEPQQIQPSTLPLDQRDSYHEYFRNLVSSHIESFNFAVGEGLHLLAEELDPMYVLGPTDADGRKTQISLRVHSLTIQKPRYNLVPGSSSTIFRPMLPMHCRLSGTSYVGDLFGAFQIIINNKDVYDIPSQRIARIPIMVGSSACHLHNKTRDELIQLGEEEYEFGGCFITNGAEKVIRFTIVPRSNHPISNFRDRNALRGDTFHDLALSFRSLRRDLSSITNHFHFLTSGGVRLRIKISRNEYFIPVGVLLRAFLPPGTTDHDIYELIVGDENDNTALCNSAIAIVRELSDAYIHFRRKDTEPGFKPTISRTAATAYLGKSFRLAMGLDDLDLSDLGAGTAFLRRYVLVHLSVGPYQYADDSLDRSKADLIVFLVRKLVATSVGDVEVDNSDSPSHHSVMTSGHLFLNLLRERIERSYGIIASTIRKEYDKQESSNRAKEKRLLNVIKSAITQVYARGDFISKGMRYLLSTGNINGNVSLDLPQMTGYTIIAERINILRYLSHFRAVHRGVFFANLRSTKVRKLLPEAWGFVCPVHTPDGEPCGILNHLASDAIVTSGSTSNRNDVVDLFPDFNIVPAPALSNLRKCSPKGYFPIIVDGRIIGYVHPDSAQEVADQIRYSKVRSAVEALPTKSEVVFVKSAKEKSGFMPGIFVHTGGGRFMRPVKWLHMLTKQVEKNHLGTGIREWIGSLEQVFLRIRPAVANQNGSLCPVNPQGATHEELTTVSFLSVLSQLSPFPDMNQGPRNMFQCQMAKQTMGTPCHAVWNRTDAKTYQHSTPQVPITRNFCMQNPLGADLFPNGVNAVVAVIGYSGNDMEDALILNKASIDRGFAHGNVYTTERVNLDDTIVGRESEFKRVPPECEESLAAIDEDGLPAPGSKIRQGSKLYGKTTGMTSGGDRNSDYVSHKLFEDGCVDQVTVYDSDMYSGVRLQRGEGIREANIRIRISRKPTVGDKFASRAGQKGTMSSAWPSEDMPFSESGMTPDILFNPNGFPSRMTIGMMVEIMSGKAGALHGRFNDSTPFQFDEEVRAIDFFAEQLVTAGYEYSGSETLYSGYTGEPLQVEIFTGIVHYQRLRHMVSDKFQVRSTGKVHPLFRQPIKGRKKGGAIRFGEMERDGLLGHGAAFLLRDRLGTASDLHVIHVCEICGSLLSPLRRKVMGVDVTCMECEEKERKGSVKKVALPYAFKYLVNELAVMNIRTILKLKEVV